MPNMAVNQIVQVRNEYRCMGQIDLNVFHWRVKAVVGTVEMFDFLKDRLLPHLDEAGNFFDDLTTYMSDECNFKYAYAQVIAPTRYRFIRHLVDRDGQEVENIRTNNLALSVSVAGELAGRGKGGRTQLPAISDKWQLNGEWSGVPTEFYTALFLQWRALDLVVPATGVTLEPVLYSPSTGAVNKIVTAFSQPTIRTMRRRTLGVGQ